MAKSKTISSKSASFAKGGSTKMFGKQAAGPQTPATTAQKDSSKGGKFAKGGTTKMFGFAKTRTAPAGKTQAR